MSIIDEALRIEYEEDDVDGAIDYIFGSINDLLVDEKLSEVDDLFTKINEDKTPTDLLISYLTITYPAKHLLKNRDNYYKRVATELGNRGYESDLILKGLE